jgi:hypothetical protein
MTIVAETTENYAYDFHMAVFGSIRPMVCAYEYVRKMRRRYHKDIEKVLNWDEGKKSKLINFLVDVVSVPRAYEDFDLWLEEIEKKLQEIEEFEEFNRLKGYFERIDSKQREMIVNIAVNRIMGYVDNILRDLVYQMRYADRESLRELFVAGSLLRVVKKLLESYRRYGNEDALSVATILILRFAAYSRGKISIDDLTWDTSSAVGYVKERILPENAFKDVVCSMR